MGEIALFGLTWLVGTAINYLWLPDFLAKRWLGKPAKSTDDQGFWERMNMLLNHTWLGPALSAVPGFLFAAGINALPTFGLAVAFFWLTAMLPIRRFAKNQGGKSMSFNMTKEWVQAASTQMLRNPHKEELEQILLRAAGSGIRSVRRAGIEGLGWLGTKAARDALLLMANAKGNPDTQAAKAALELASKPLPVASVLSTKALKEKLTRWDLLQRKRKTVSNKKTGEYRQLGNMVETTEKEIDDFLRPHIGWHLRSGATYCYHCNAPGHVVMHGQWTWKECTQCHTADHLIGPVNKVIGQVGGAPNWELKDGVLRLSLWNHAEKRVIPAHVDAVEVIGGGDMDYDWALSAVLERLINERPDLAKGLKVQLTNSPQLSTNTEAVLYRTVNEVIS